MSQGNADLLCGMLGTRGELLQQLQGLREDTAWTRPEPNEWSVVEILQHVADVDQLLVRRLRDVLAGESQLVAYDAMDWEADRKEAEKGGLAGVLCRFYALRTEALQAVSRLSATDLERSAVHPKRGPMTARQIVEMEIQHDRDHAGQIAKTRTVVEA